jgi:RNA polymerase sigma-70 factor (ECF subfamily)
MLFTAAGHDVWSFLYQVTRRKPENSLNRGCATPGSRASARVSRPPMADDHSRLPEITELLIACSGGRREALDDLIPVVYKDLRRIAAGYMQRERAGHPLQPTALVSEAYLRLIDQRRVQWRNRAHFFGVAAGMMRRILVDHARRRRAERRGGDWERVTLTGLDVAANEPSQLDVLALHESLERLAVFDPQQARIVELRYFGGLTIDEAAEVVGVSEATVAREWTMAKAWLRANLSPRSE